jgi:glucuronate isomerase
MSFLGEKYLIDNAAGQRLYGAVRHLPIVDAHNHANVKEIAANDNYADVWQLFAATDHYVWEMLRKRGVPEEYITGDRSNEEKWLKLASVFPEIAGNPVYEWVHLDLRRYLGITKLIGPDTGAAIWTEANAVLAKPESKPLALLEKIGVEVMCSTDDPIDSLRDHRTVAKVSGKTLIRPTWRPDKAMKIGNPGWRDYVEKVAERFNMKIESLDDLLQAMSLSHDFFAENGCVATDHGLEVMVSGTASKRDADAVFRKALRSEPLSAEEIDTYMSCFLGEVCEFNAKKGWVTQLHLGAVRDVRDSLFKSLGPDVGGDICNSMQDQMRPLIPFLNRFDNRLKVVLYCLDPAHQSMLATMARAFGEKVRLGSAWWLLDTPVGMRRQLEYIGSVDTFANFAGMVSDSRKLLSYGSRFEMFRRVLCSVLGEHVERGQAPYEVIEKLVAGMCYRNTKEFYNL